MRASTSAAMAVAFLAAAAAPAVASATESGSAATAKSITITTHKNSLGTYLVDKSGHTLYLWAADGKNKSVCTGACATYWPPVVGAPKAVGGVAKAGLKTITRADGKKQVTYYGHPLYYYLGDKKVGATTGQGDNGFGAKWWVVSKTGKAITTVAR